MASGYVPCRCRDCFDTAITGNDEDVAFCHECESAGCEDDKECCRTDAYGCEEDETPSDYEECGTCGYDHEYDLIDAASQTASFRAHVDAGDELS